MCMIPRLPEKSAFHPMITVTLFLMLGFSIGAGIASTRDQAQMDERFEALKSRAPDVSITVFSPAFSCIPFQVYGEYLCLLLERINIRKVDLAEESFYPSIDAPFSEVDSAFTAFVQENPVSTDYALFGEYVAPMADSTAAIRTFLVDGRGNAVWTDERPTDVEDFRRIGAEGTDGAALLLAGKLGASLGLPDPRRADAPEGRWAAYFAEKTGTPLRSEVAPLDGRVTVLRKVFKDSELVIFTIMLNEKTDRQSASDLAQILNESKLCSARVAPAETLFELDMSGDATRMLWDFARKFRSRAKENGLDADYQLYAHYYFFENSEGEEAVGLVLIVLCDRKGEWVAVDGQSERTQGFREVSPKTTFDCNRLVAERLKFYSTPQKVVGIGVIIKRDDFGHLMITRILEKGPAAEVGLEVNDVITKVDGQEIKDLTLMETVSRITGAAGTKVTLTIRRGTETMDYAITRREVVFE